MIVVVIVAFVTLITYEAVTEKLTRTMGAYEFGDAVKTTISIVAGIMTLFFMMGLLITYFVK